MELKIKGIIYKLTGHAKQRMKTRKVSVEDVIEALTNPRFTRKQESYGKTKRLATMGRNKVNVIFEENTNVIITVYGYNKEYTRAKNKHHKNKNRRKLKKAIGNRYR